jgi:hypothetical protein
MRSRCLLIALALLAPFASDSWGQSKRPPPDRNQTQRADQPAAADPRGTRQSPAIVKILPPEDAEAKAKQEADDRAAKERLDTNTIRLGVAAIVVAFLQFVGIGIQAWFLQGTLKVTAAAADAAKDASKASLLGLRPWISCNVQIAGPLTYTAAGDAQFEFRVIVKNVGHSPAFGVNLTPSLNLLSPKHEHSILKLQKIAHLNRETPIDAPGVLLPGGTPIGGAELGLILFPEETFTFNYKIPISRDEIEKSFEDIKPARYFFPEVFGLVTYLYPLAAVRADTGFVCSIENVSPGSKSGLAFELGQPVRADYMRVADASLWSGFAT